MFNRLLFRGLSTRAGVAVPSRIGAISGAFESHVIVKPEDQMKLFAFASEYKGPNVVFKGLRPTCAITAYGDHPNQPMITAHITGTADYAMEKTNHLARYMGMMGMTPLRVKVEANVQCKGVPVTTEEISNSDFAEKYFEYHFKVETKSHHEWTRLAELIARFHGAHLFFNPYSQRGHFQPVVTVRQYDMGSYHANIMCDGLLSTVQSAGFTVSSHVDREFSIMDTAVEMDAGWLSESKDKPKEFLYHVPAPVIYLSPLLVSYL